MQASHRVAGGTTTAIAVEHISPKVKVKRVSKCKVLARLVFAVQLT